MSLAKTDVPMTDPYGTALRSMDDSSGSRSWLARYEGGASRSLGEALRRRCGTADPTDRELHDRAPGAVLDAGGGWSDWAHVGAVDAPAADAGRRVDESWQRPGRWFAALVPAPARRPGPAS